MYDVEAVRARFPALGGQDDRQPLFLDNPGGTQVPQGVIDAITDCLLHANANLGGAFRTSRAADAVVWAAREAMADFVNAASPREIVFGQNMTTLTFHLSRSLGLRLKPGDEILLTRMDHDANVSPWLLLARDLGLEVKFLPFDLESYEFDLAELDELIGERTRLVCINHASNLTGTINDVAAIAAKAHAVGALVYVDSVQFAPHGSIDVQALDCDFLVCSAYKFYGPHVGILWGRLPLLEELDPYRVRPAGDRAPDCFETGTLNHEGLAGTTAAVEHFAWVGREMAGRTLVAGDAGLTGRRLEVRRGVTAMIDYETPLTRRLIEGLGAFEGLRVQGITNPNAFARRVPTVSLTVAGRDPKDLAEALAAEEIYVWSGHNYAVEPATALGLMDSGGVLRIGLAHYNTAEEVERILGALGRCLG
jgi:cysteine desulfurase family protein (TIGR01976 family)